MLYSFLSAILLLSYGVHWDLSCRRFQPETIFFLLAYHIQCCRFPYKKVPLSCASATVHNPLYTCQVLPSKRYRENLFQNLEAILPCFRYKIQCYGYFSCLFTCTSGILYLLYRLNIRKSILNFRFVVLKVFSPLFLRFIFSTIITGIRPVDFPFKIFISGNYTGFQFIHSNHPFF